MRGSTIEARLYKVIEELGRCEKQKLRLAETVKITREAKATLEEENAKLKVEKVELQQQLQESQGDLQTI